MIIGLLFLSGREILGPLFLGEREIPGLGLLFEHIGGGREGEAGFGIPVSDSLWAISQIGAIVLLFIAGLETDLRLFLRYAGPAILVAVGGVVLPFVFGVVATVLFGFADSYTDPKALFIGAVMTATSVGITVRVLGDIRRLDTPEGVTIIGAAVLDDVLGILALTIVIGINDTGEFSLPSVSLVAVKSLGFWIALTGVGILLAGRISGLFQKFQVSGAAVALSVGLAFLAAGLAESFGLAMIIGAFSIGLALSGTELAHRLEGALQGVYAVLVPIFFVVIGMIVDVSAMGGIWAFGLLITVLAAIGKIVGGGGPGLLTGFNRHGAWRIGIGIMPRGEIALITAGIGVSAGIIGADLFGVTIMMTIVTTISAPVILTRAFHNGVSGSRSSAVTQSESHPPQPDSLD